MNQASSTGQAEQRMQQFADLPTDDEPWDVYSRDDHELEALIAVTDGQCSDQLALFMEDLLWGVIEPAYNVEKEDLANMSDARRLAYAARLLRTVAGYSCVRTAFSGQDGGLGNESIAIVSLVWRIYDIAFQDAP